MKVWWDQSPTQALPALLFYFYNKISVAFSCCPRIVTGAKVLNTPVPKFRDPPAVGASYVPGGTGQSWLGIPGPQSIPGKTGRDTGSSGGGEVKEGDPERTACLKDDWLCLPEPSPLGNRNTGPVSSLCTLMLSGYVLHIMSFGPYTCPGRQRLVLFLSHMRILRLGEVNTSRGWRYEVAKPDLHPIQP